MNVGWIVNDKCAVPHHGEVDGEVADVTALVVVLRREKEQKRGKKSLFMTDLILFGQRCSYKSIIAETDTVTGGLQPQSSGGVNTEGRREERKERREVDNKRG